jgi:hypothetical protein
VHTQTANAPAELQPYVRPSRFELEPTAFALAVVAVVMSISLWNPATDAQQLAPADQTPTVAEAPRG